jgi:phage major head subunit gpT-like protein
MGASKLSSRAIIGQFYQRLEQNPGLEWVQAVSNYFTSDQESETYRWLGQVPVMREWIGGRQAKGFRENGITIENRHFEATLELLTRELRLDKTGQVMVRVNELADRTNGHWAKLVSDLVVNAESRVAYDGQYFFDTDHSEGKSGSQSNSLSVDISGLPVEVHGSTTLPSVEEMQLAILKVIQQIFSFKDDQGEPMNENARSFLIMVPTAMWHVAKAATAAPVITHGQTNIVQVMDEVQLSITQNPRLPWTDKFAVFRTDGAVKPFIRQEEEPVALKAVAEGSELEFNEDKHHYGVDTWRNVGYGFWQHACLAQLT